MALTDCYVLRDIQSFNGELILNVYFYQDLLLASVAQNVVESFVADMLPKVRAIQTNVLKHEVIDAVNMADPANFYETPINLLGLVATEAMAAHDAINYSLRLNSRALRPGSKRYCGIPDNASSNNTFADSGFLAAAETLRVQLFTPLLSGVLVTFQPIVVKRVPYNPDPLDLGKFAYRLPETEGEFVFGDVTSALLNLRVSHQVSRNNGR